MKTMSAREAKNAFGLMIDTARATILSFHEFIGSQGVGVFFPWVGCLSVGGCGPCLRCALRSLLPPSVASRSCRCVCFGGCGGVRCGSVFSFSLPRFSGVGVFVFSPPVVRVASVGRAVLAVSSFLFPRVPPPLRWWSVFFPPFVPAACWGGPSVRSVVLPRRAPRLSRPPLSPCAAPSRFLRGLPLQGGARGGVPPAGWSVGWWCVGGPRRPPGGGARGVGSFFFSVSFLFFSLGSLPSPGPASPCVAASRSRSSGAPPFRAGAVVPLVAGGLFGFLLSLSWCEGRATASRWRSAA